mgnify:CR=1 FL=1
MVATVESSKGFIDEGRVFTRTELRVEETWKGKPGATVEIVHIGGRAGKLATVVHGMPMFVVGERAVVFLEQPEGFEHFVVTGLSQGKLAVRKTDSGTSVVVPQLDPGSLVAPVKLPDGSVKLERAPAVKSPPARTLDDLRGRVQALLQPAKSKAKTE